MEGDHKDVKTLECLRARLVAERQASKFAKDHSLRLENKLVEIEKMLKEEIKLRNKAEKRLKFLNKKLQSLNTTDPTTSSTNSVTNSVASDFSDNNNSSAELRFSSISSKTGTDYEEDCVNVVDYDNSLALVPLSSSSSIIDVNNKAVNENVAQVLDSLKYIRETIQSSLEMRCLVR